MEQTLTAKETRRLSALIDDCWTLIETIDKTSCDSFDAHDHAARKRVIEFDKAKRCLSANLQQMQFLITVPQDVLDIAHDSGALSGALLTAGEGAGTTLKEWKIGLARQELTRLKHGIEGAAHKKGDPGRPCYYAKSVAYGVEERRRKPATPWKDIYEVCKRRCNEVSEWKEEKGKLPGLEAYKAAVRRALRPRS